MKTDILIYRFYKRLAEIQHKHYNPPTGIELKVQRRALTTMLNDCKGDKDLLNEILVFILNDESHWWDTILTKIDSLVGISGKIYVSAKKEIISRRQE